MDAWSGTVVAVAFVWLGMVLAISFLGAPLKFRAPGVTIPLGLGIGRLVFRALNAVEAVLAVVVVAALVWGSLDGLATAALVAAVAALLAQLAVVRPRLTRRSEEVLAGRDGGRSHVHLVYIGLEVLKVVALVVGGLVTIASPI